MTSQQIVEKLIKIIEDTCPEDNYNRARSEFRGYSEKELDQPYGESDETPREILTCYKNQVDEKNELLGYIKKLKELLNG